MTATILEKIKAYKLDEIAARKAERSMEDLGQLISDAPPVRKFADRLFDATKSGGYGLIAEIKKASPSKGVIREDFDPVALAAAYEDGGASCLSILTDGPSFQGKDAFLTEARAACSLPVLRKDFIYDPYQVAEARAIHADCILIIMASVSDGQATELEDAAISYGIDVLIEIHNAEELDRALGLKSKLLGINNRNLHTFETDLATTEQLSRDIPGDRLMVSESGIFTPNDLARLARVGARCFLVGESLMRQPDVAGATRKLLSAPLGPQAM